MANSVGKRRMPTAERRRVILAAATQVVAERGAEAASISDIAERAGITRPIVYDHFPTKQDIILALIEHHHTTLMTVLGDLATGPRLDKRTLRRIVVAYLHQVDADPGGWRILCLEPSRDPRIAAVQRRTAGEVNLVVAEMLNPATPLQLRLTVVEGARAAVNALADLRQHDPRIGIDELADATVALLWDGLRRL
jgi:AcrR family transcriptional regulator